MPARLDPPHAPAAADPDAVAVAVAKPHADARPADPDPGPSFRLHRVERGDTLTSIARKYGTSGRSIAYWNRDEYPTLDPESPRYDPNALQRGWILKVLPGEEYVPPPDDGETGESPTPSPPDDEYEPVP